MRPQSPYAASVSPLFHFRPSDKSAARFFFRSVSSEFSTSTFSSVSRLIFPFFKLDLSSSRGDKGAGGVTFFAALFECSLQNRMQNFTQQDVKITIMSTEQFAVWAAKLCIIALLLTANSKKVGHI